MGIIIIHSVIVTGYSKEAVRRLHDECEGHIGRTPIVHGSSGTCSFALLPDGGKEGRKTSDDNEAIRERLLERLKEANAGHACLDYAEVVEDHQSGRGTYMGRNDRDED